jgi:hypothetical protein
MTKGSRGKEFEDPTHSSGSKVEDNGRRARSILSASKGTPGIVWKSTGCQ